MLSIDTENYLISLTRGDTATINFSAEEQDGSLYEEQQGDVLTFAVAKKVGSDILFKESNTYSGTHTDDNMTVAEISADDFAESPTKYFTESGGVYTRCLENAIYDGGETYYTCDFWDIRIESDDTNELKFKDYVWDLQIETGGNVETIIGQTDTVSPIFRVWGEVAEEGGE